MFQAVYSITQILVGRTSQLCSQFHPCMIANYYVKTQQVNNCYENWRIGKVLRPSVFYTI